jgi:hypothetical protein
VAVFFAVFLTAALLQVYLWAQLGRRLAGTRGISPEEGFWVGALLGPLGLIYMCWRVRLVRWLADRREAGGS